MPLIENFRYRPEIDGLRAVAVLAVVLYHSGFGCPGGFVGVDVFFVISGFLITSLIWKDLERATFTFAGFWERRARRILPAMVVVTIATVIAGWFLLLPTDFKSLGRAALSQALFAANFHYWADTGYFRGEADEKPLLHTWSLAVEEQFYFFMPFILWALFRFAFFRRRTPLVSLLSVGFLVSFGLSVVGVTRHPNATFFFLPTRAWELLMGSLVAFAPLSAVPPSRIIREVVTLIGMTLILVPVGTYSLATPFPGLAALPPCLGTALVIWANSRAEVDIPTALGRLLASRPMVFIGLISYSLYLWHWPVLAFAHYLAVDELSPVYRVVLMTTGFLLALLSWRFVETPFRERTLGTTRKSMFSYAGMGIAAVALCGTVCMVTEGFPKRFPPEVVEIEKSRSDMRFQANVSAEKIRKNELVTIGDKDSKDKSSILIWGDSHAMAALPAIDELLKEKGIEGQAITSSGRPPVIDWSGQRDAVYSEAVFAYIKREKITDVILIGFWNDYKTKEGPSGSFDQALLKTVRDLKAIGVQPWIVFDVPSHTFNVPAEVARSVIYDTDVSQICSRPVPSNKYDGIDPDVIAEIQKAGARLLDPKPSFLDPTGRFYMVKLGDTVLYRDDDHVTTKGANQILLPFFRDSLSAVGNKLKGSDKRTEN